MVCLANVTHVPPSGTEVKRAGHPKGDLRLGGAVHILVKPHYALARLCDRLLHLFHREEIISSAGRTEKGHWEWEYGI
jgi:hypothetical protein